MATLTIHVDDDELARFLGTFHQGVTIEQNNTPPWNDAQPSAPQTAPQGDPWDSTAAPAQPVQSQQQTTYNPPAQPPAQPPQGRPAAGVVTDNKGKTWTFGAPNAPRCQHGEPAALVSAISQKSGKPYKQWRCARDFDDYKTKCQFSQWA